LLLLLLWLNFFERGRVRALDFRLWSEQEREQASGGGEMKWRSSGDFLVVLL